MSKIFLAHAIVPTVIIHLVDVQKMISREEFEKEGFTELPELSPFTRKPYKYVKFRETHFNEPHLWTIEYNSVNDMKIRHAWESSWNNFDEYIYQGICPDIKTFHHLCTLLNIK